MTRGGASTFTDAPGFHLGYLEQDALGTLLRLSAAGVPGGPIGFERRAHGKATGMVLTAIGSTTYMDLTTQFKGTIRAPSAARFAVQ